MGAGKVSKQKTQSEIKTLVNITEASNEVSINKLFSQNQNIHDFFEFQDVIATGEFGKVYMALKKETKKLFAVKEISLLNLNENQLKRLENEVTILSKLDHPNIISYYQTFSDKESFYIVTAFYSGGSVEEELSKRSFDEDEVRDLVRTLLYAVSYCHRNKIVHRDIKMGNIVYHNEAKKLEEIKLIDFGLAKINDDTNGLMHTTVGTMVFCAPEVFSKTYTEKCDIWSVGVLTYILLSKFHPFDGPSAKAIQKNIKTKSVSFDLKAFADVSNECKDFILKLLPKDPQTRLSADGALKHVWFTNENFDAMSFKSREISDLKDFALYQEVNMFQKMFFNFFIFDVDDKVYSEINNLFKELDTENTGFVGYESIRKALLKKENLIKDKNLVNFIKTNNKKEFSLNYSQFFTILALKKQDYSIDKMKELFKEIDTDDKGFISVDDLRECFNRRGRNKTNKEIKDLLRKSNIFEETIDFKTFHSFFTNIFKEKIE